MTQSGSYIALITALLIYLCVENPGFPSAATIFSISDGPFHCWLITDGYLNVLKINLRDMRMNGSSMDL
jgi:hypothetical protein